MNKNISTLLLSALLFMTGCEANSPTPEHIDSTAGTNTSITSSFSNEETSLIHTSEQQSECVNSSNSTSEPTEEAEITTSETSAPQTTVTTTTTVITTTTVTETEIKIEPPAEYQELKVHFLDVGQGDSTFIELPNGETMLIDAGEREYGDSVVTYIYSQGYDALNYVVATHPHSDHIGGMADIINTFNVDNFYMTSDITTTQTFDDLLTALENSKAAVHDVMAGDIILDEPDLLIEVVAPKEIADDLNNNSVVIKLTYGDNKFLFTGDAEKSEEDGIWTNIKCDVLKVGHHGSNTSSTANFLKKVEPTYAVISCGVGNSYGHPDDKVLKRLDERNINVYRTDLQGTIVFSSDGKSISADKTPIRYTPPVTTTTTVTEPPEEHNSTVTYVLNTNSKKIHYPDCPSVDQMKDKNKAYTDDYAGAIAQGYVPCKNCNPTG